MTRTNRRFSRRVAIGDRARASVPNCSAIAVGVVALGSLGCSDKVPLEDRVLEIAAVRVDPPSGEPGATLNAEILHQGRISPQEDEAEYEVAWLGGCHNPAGGDYSACLPRLQTLVRKLSSPVHDTPAEQLEQLAGKFGLGPTFAFRIPESIVQEESGYGVSHVFFAVCRGHLLPAPERESTVPLRCVDDAGRARGLEDYDVGYTTVYTFDGVSNGLPRLEGLMLDGERVAQGSCETDVDCTELSHGQLEYGCVDGQCLPVVPSCASNCAAVELEPLVDPTSFEPNPWTPDLPSEVIRVRLHTALDVLEADDAYAMEALLEGDRRRIGVRVPDGQGSGVVPVWFVISDNRWALNWRSWEVLVR